jgi:hypothetical protein
MFELRLHRQLHPYNMAPLQLDEEVARIPLELPLSFRCDSAV